MVVPGSPPWCEDKWREEILRRELVVQASVLANLAAKLEHGEDFPTATPPRLCRLFEETAKIIGNYIPSAPAKHLRIVNNVLCTIAEYLRFIERSRMTQTPWSMVQAAEAFLKRQAGKECEFIIRPQWAFNYGIVGEFVEVCREMIRLLPWIPLADWEKAVGEIGRRRIYCLSFPRIQRLNCLSHASWGHEVGHIIALRWLNKEFQNLWAKEKPKIRKAIEKDVLANPPPVEPLLKDLYIQDVVVNKLMCAADVARQGLEELLCDAIGVHLLGPAALAAACEFSARYYLDESPLQRGQYPPWRYRLRLMLEECEEDLKNCKPAASTDLEYPGPLLKEYILWLKEVSLLVADNKDEQVLKGDVITRVVYSLIEKRWPSIRKAVLKLLPKNSSRPYRLRERVAIINDLITKIEEGIPPNEEGVWPSTTVATFEDVLNAGWAFKMTKVRTQSGWGSAEDCQGLFCLLLKGMESSFVQSTFGTRLPVPQA